MDNLKGLYAIADIQCIGTMHFLKKVENVLTAGIKIIQYRDKTNSADLRYRIAKEIKPLTSKYQALFIVNDDIELAKQVNADGVHLGKNDGPIYEARDVLGETKIIGASCYDKFENAIEAEHAGADYVAFGSFYQSSSKPLAPRADLNLIIRAKNELCIPVCAIGGINKDNIKPLIDAGADMIAVISSIFASKSPKQTVKEYLRLLQQFDLTA